MEKEFVPYDLALELKDLGFGEECIGYWRDENKPCPITMCKYTTKYDFDDDINFPKFKCLAPLWQQAFDWFREQLLLDSYIMPYWFIDSEYKSKRYTFSIEPSNKLDELFDCDADEYDNYEEAELECLKKLIEIVKE